MCFIWLLFHVLIVANTENFMAMREAVFEFFCPEYWKTTNFYPFLCDISIKTLLLLWLKVSTRICCFAGYCVIFSTNDVQLIKVIEAEYSDEIKVRFMAEKVTPNSKTFTWPKLQDESWVERNHVTKISHPKLLTGRRIRFEFATEELTNCLINMMKP